MPDENNHLSDRWRAGSQTPETSRLTFPRSGELDRLRGLDGMPEKPGPASQLRILRMRGREGQTREALAASAQYRACREWLSRCERPPELILDQG